MPEFRRIRKPKEHISGYVVIHSDDGKITDWTHWQKLFSEKNAKYNQWGKTVVPFCPAVNTNNINSRSSYMNDKQLREIIRLGGEVMSHGRYHIGMLPHSTTADVVSGSTEIPVNRINRVLNKEPVEYEISGGGNTETFIVVGSDQASGIIYTEKTLTHSYPAGSEVKATYNTAVVEWGGAIEDLAGWGIEVKNHVYPWNENDERMRTWAYDFFESASGSDTVPINYKGQDIMNIKRRDITGMSQQLILETIDEAKNTNGIAIFYAHGNTDQNTMSKLDAIVEKCLNEGVKIIRQTDAVRILMS